MIEIKFVGFPAIYDYLKKDHIWHTFSGRTLKDLIDDLFSHYGEEIRESLWDERIDELDPTIQIKVNGHNTQWCFISSLEVNRYTFER